jgi:hypothetical protein
VEDGSYRALIGKLLYVSEWTRPDITFATNFLAKYTNMATSTHMKLLTRVVRYLFATREKKITYKWDLNPQLMAYSDSDYANDKDSRRSISGYITTIDGAPLNWKSTQQKVTALSSSEAEYMALSECAREIKFMQNIAQEIPDILNWKSIHVNVDNTCAIAYAENESTHKRSKHIDVRYHFIRDLIEEERISLSYIKSEDNTADLLTKPLGKVQHYQHTNKVLR